MANPAEKRQKVAKKKSRSSVATENSKEEDELRSEEVMEGKDSLRDMGWSFLKIKAIVTIG